VLVYNAGLVLEGPSPIFLPGAKNNSLNLAGMVKSFFISQTHSTIFSHVCQVVSTVQERVTNALGCVPTALAYNVKIKCLLVQTEEKTSTHCFFINKTKMTMFCIFVDEMKTTMFQKNVST